MKKIFKRLLLWLSSKCFHNRKSKILFYHDVFGTNKYTNMGTPLNIFAKHVQTIRNSGFTITNRISKPENEVMICFDDGFKGIYDTKDFFIKEGIHPTVFLAVSLIGKSGYLNKDEILELQNAGFIFQCHAWSHCDLTTFSEESLRHELLDSKEFLEKFLQKEVNEICFPIGYFSQQVLDECSKYGFKVMYSSIPGNYFDHIYVAGLKTRNLLQFADEIETKLVLLGGNELIRNRYIKMHWRE